MNCKKTMNYDRMHKHRCMHEIHKLKRKLSATDIVARAYENGRITKEEYAPIRAERARCQAEINELEAKIIEIKNKKE